MKRLMLALLAMFALIASAPAVSEAQVRVSVNLGHRPRYGYTYRVYTPRSYYSGYHTAYRNSYRGSYYARPRVEVVRVYRPRPVVVYRAHRGYRGYNHR